MTRGVWVAFLTLCLLGGSVWVTDEGMLAGVLVEPLRTAVYFAVLAGLALGSGRFLRTRTEMSWKQRAVIAGTFVFVFGVPAALLQATGLRVSSLVGALVIMGVPVAVVFATAQQQIGFGDGGNRLQALTPALAGLLGAVLLIPFDWPVSFAGRAGFCALVICTIVAGFAAVRLHRELQEVHPIQAAAVGFAACAVLMGVGCWFSLWSNGTGLFVWSWNGLVNDSLRFAVLAMPQSILVVWLLPRMKPVAFSSRYFLIPLVTIAENLALLKPATTWTTWAGLALIAGGAVALLRADSHEVLCVKEM